MTKAPTIADPDGDDEGPPRDQASSTATAIGQTTYHCSSMASDQKWATGEGARHRASYPPVA